MTDPIKSYDAIVVTSETNDRYRAGSVRAKIFGWSDGLDDKDQPWVCPTGGTTQKPPGVGTFLKIRFIEGDPGMPEYYSQGVGASSFLHSIYREEYPNTTVVDLGEVLTKSNEASHVFVEENTYSGYTRTVDAKQKTTVEATNGYSVIDKERQLTSRVMTEDMVNIATGRPFHQGSAFYKIPVFEESQISPDTDGSVGT